MFGDGHPLVAFEELLCIAGVWKVDFKLGTIHTTNDDTMEGAKGS